MGLPRTYALSDLEAESGFDKRTIAYYISEGLLPKVGRRGPKTRYPQDFLDRLMFIRRVRDLQDAGKVRPVTLQEISEIMDGLPAERIRNGAHSADIAEWIIGLFNEYGSAMPVSATMVVPAEDLAANLDPDALDEANWDSAELLSLTECRQEPEEKQSNFAAASRRRDNLRMRMERQDLQINQSLADRASERGELMEAIRRFEFRMEKMSHSMREELRDEMRQLKDVVFEMHDRLQALETRIKRGDGDETDGGGRD